MSNIFDGIMQFFQRFSGDYFFSTPLETITIWFLFSFFIASAVVAFGVFMFIKVKNRNSLAYQEYAKAFFWPNLTLITLGLFITFFRYENIQILSWRIWLYLTLLVMVVFNAWVLVKKRSELEDKLYKDQVKKRKDKWIKKKGR